MKPKKKGLERYLVNWLKDEYRSQKRVVLMGATEIRELLLPVAGMDRTQLSPGMAGRIDRMARHELAREPNAPGITIPLAANRYQRSNVPTPEERHQSVVQRTRALATQEENLAAIAANHAAQPDATPDEVLTAERHRIASLVLQATTP